MAAVTDLFALTGTLFADRFVIEAAIAEGGFGVVYRARQQGLGRAVAIKVLKISDELPQRTRMALFDSFRREARIIAELGHPAIVQVISNDIGDDRGAAHHARSPRNRPRGVTRP